MMTIMDDPVKEAEVTLDEAASFLLHEQSINRLKYKHNLKR